MESALRSLTIQKLKNQLSGCEWESAALAKEVLSPSTTAQRRNEVLMLRASMQTRSVDLWRDLQELQREEAGASLSMAFPSRRVSKLPRN